MTRLAILSPGYPAAEGGVTEHTRRLARHWSAAGHTVLVTGDLETPPEALAAAWRAESVNAVLIQYVPFLYGRRGLSDYPERLARSSRGQGIRVATFIHEPWVPPTRLPWLLLSPLQRRRTLRLVRSSQLAITAVPRWRKLVDPPPTLVYVGSTLGETVSTDPADTRIDSPVVFSPFAAGLAWDWIAAAADAIGATPSLTVIGATRAQAQAHPATSRLLERGWDFRGRPPADEVLRLLGRARLVLAPFVDGLTGRRTSALAALSTGARVVSSTGPLFDAFFATGPLTLGADLEQFTAAAVRLWHSDDCPGHRAERLAWYQVHLDPRRLDEELLRLVTGQPEPTR